MIESIPLADSRRLAPQANRTRILRLGLAAALVIAGVAVVLLARSTPAPIPLLAAGSQTIVVLDVSGSVELDKLRLAYGTLETLGHSGARVGLVVFSSYAYESLPPGSPAADLLPVASLFRATHRPGRQVTLPPNPWVQGFANGTEISSGLELARSIATADRLSRPSVLLISDLFDDKDDLAHVSAEGREYKRLGITLRIVPLNPTAGDLRYVLRALGPVGSAVQAPRPGSSRTLFRSSFPTGFAVVAVLLAALLAMNEILCAPLRWSSGRRAEASA